MERRETQYMTYKFEDKKHIHTLDGKPLFGVTTVLGVIAKPQLISWAANTAVEYVKEKWGENGLTKKELFNVLEDARKAHQIKKEKAGDWGTYLHKHIELWIKDKKEPELDGTQKEVFNKFMVWVKDNNVEFLESEKHLYSKNLWIGGIMDMVLTINGKKYIGDIKTSSGIYPEMWAQMGAYHLCLQEMGEHLDIEGYIIINLKKNGEINFGITDQIEFNQNFFKAALELYKHKQQADKSI